MNDYAELRSMVEVPNLTGRDLYVTVSSRRVRAALAQEQGD